MAYILKKHHVFRIRYMAFMHVYIIYLFASHKYKNIQTRIISCTYSHWKWKSNFNQIFSPMFSYRIIKSFHCFSLDFECEPISIAIPTAHIANAELNMY